MLAILSGIAVIFVLFTGMAVGSYRKKESELAREWQGKGQAYLSASQPVRAVEAFQTALRYDPGSQQLRYAMVDALLAAGRSEQARSYLLNMWEHEPANATVNLRLGRIAAARGDVTRATLYYHNAVYGVWEKSAQQHRIETRLELARFLLKQKQVREADAELVALAANAPPTPELASQLGELFLEADDLQNAQEQFESVLKKSPHDPKALAGAGQAAFAQGKYATAYSYLQRAEAHGASGPDVSELLKTSEMILNNDPLDRRVAFDVRVRRTVQALATATDRLESCAAQTDTQGGTPPQIEQALQQLAAAQDKKNLRSLRHDPDLVIASAGLVFSAEELAAKSCGRPQGMDLALLLIGRSHAEATQ